MSEDYQFHPQMVKLAIQDQGGFREISGCYCGAAEISPNVRFLWVSAVGLGVYCQDILPPQISAQN